MALTDKQRRFVDEYLVDMNATAAYIRAGYVAKGHAAEVNAARLLRNAEVQTYLQVRQKDLQQRTEITQEAVLQRYWAIATADPNDLVEYRRANCRYCWGIGFQYQWTEGEFEKARQEAIENTKPLPESPGGFGFTPARPPHPDCPECGGEGRGRIHVHDTRKVTGPARLLYAGVKQGKDGLEVKMLDQLAALNKVAEHIGFNRNPAAERRAQEAHEAELERKRLESAKLKRESEQGAGSGVSNIMPVPTADSVDSWEEVAMAQQDKVLGR